MALIANQTSVALPTSKLGDRRRFTETIADFDRPANVVPYVAGDVVGDDAAVAKSMVFPNAALIKGGGGRVMHAIVAYGSNIVTPPDFNLYIMSDEGNSNPDGAEWAPTDSDMTKMLSVVSFVGTSAKLVNDSVGAPGILLYVSPLIFPLAFKCNSAKTNIFGILQAATAFTPTSGDRVMVKLMLELDH